MLDILIRGGLIVDGSGRAPYPGDLAIRNGRITAVGRLEGATAATVVNAGGLVVSPGFIDMHSHSDLSLPDHPNEISSLKQGVTTEVAGNCGWSLAPVKAETVASVLKGLCEDLLGAVPRAMRNGGDPSGSALPWFSFGEYLSYVEGLRPGCNLYPIVGQGLIRAHVVGKARRPATPAEIRAMRELLAACLEEGARGMSAGRAYVPGGHASTEEITDLCRVVAAHDGLYASHIKDESAGVVEAVAEAIRIGRESGVRVEVSHHKVIGRANFGKVGLTLEMMEEARRSGVDISCDAYPYAFAQVFSLLNEVPGVTLDRSLEEVRALLGQAGFRETVTSELAGAWAGRGSPPGFLTRPEHVRLIAVGRDRDLEGETLGKVFGPDPLGLASGTPGSPPEAALLPPAPPDRARLRALVDQWLDFLLAQDLRVNVASIMSEEDVETVLRHPATMLGSDAFAVDHDLGDRTPIHPRHFGAFPRLLGYYRRERCLGDLAAMVRKVTGLPAEKLRLAGRGLLAPGAWADVVVFDPEVIADRATAQQPYLEPVGVRWVIVNGQAAVRDGEVTGVRAGVVLGSGRGGA